MLFTTENSVKIGSKVLFNRDLIEAWKRGNDAGNGYAVGLETDTPRQAVGASSLTYRGDLDPSGGSVVSSDCERIVVVRDANGPWAVDVTSMFDDSGDLLED